MHKGVPHPMNAPVTAAEKYREALREVARRRLVYDQRVREGHMTVPVAARKIGIMQAIAEDYRGLAGLPKEKPDADHEPEAARG